MTIAILDSKPIGNVTRIVECANCLKPAVVQQILELGACPSCSVMLCAFCGCTSDRACLHPDFPDVPYMNCSWSNEYMTCTRCFDQLVENAYRLVNGDDNPPPFKQPQRPLIRSIAA